MKLLPSVLIGAGFILLFAVAVLSTIDQYSITCDKTTYQALDSFYVECSVKEQANMKSDANVSLLFGNALPDIQQAWVWENISHSVPSTTYNAGKAFYLVNDTPLKDDVNGTKFQLPTCADYNLSHCSQPTNYAVTTYSAQWYYDWKAINWQKEGAKQYLNGLTIDKTETKRVRFLIHIPFRSKGEFNVTTTSPTGAGLLDPWWDNNWANKRNITANVTGPWHNATIVFTINSTALTNLESDCRSLRVLDSTETYTLLWNYANRTDPTVGCGTQNMTIMVLFPNGTDGLNNATAYIYWNNGAAADGATNSSVWNTSAIGIWPLNGDAIDKSVIGNNLNGKSGCCNFINVSADSRHKSADFDGGDDRYDAASTVTPVKYTALIWFRNTRHANTDGVLIGNDNGQGGGSRRGFMAYLSITVGGSFAITAYDGTGGGTCSVQGQTMSGDTWHFVGLRLDDTNLFTITDGRLDTSTGCGGVSYDSTAFSVGSRADAYGPILGQTAWAMVFNRALNQTEIYAIMNATRPAMTVEGVLQTIPAAATILSITNPANRTTFVGTNTLLTIRPTGPDASYTCYRMLIDSQNNNTQVNLGSITNNTQSNFNITGISHDTHNNTVICSGASGNFSNSTVFTNFFWSANATSGQSTVYETNSTTFSMDIAIANDRIANVSGVARWNGTDYAATNSSIGVDFYRMAATVNPIPLLTVNNNTDISWNFNFSLGFQNGTVENVVGNMTNQTIFFAYILQAVNSTQAQWFMGEPVVINATVTNIVRNSLNNVTLGFAGQVTRNVTNTSITNDASTYGTTLNAPSINSTQSINATATFELAGRRRTASVNSTLSIYAPQIGACGGNRTTTAFYFNHYNERNASTTNNSIIGVTFHAFSAANPNIQLVFSANFSQLNTTHEVCIYPNIANFQINAEIDYGNTTNDYNQRSFFVFNKTVTNSTGVGNANISLFALEREVSENVVITVQDISGTNQPNIVVEVQKYYTSNDTYQSIAMGRTGPNGKTPIPLERFNSWYRFILRNTDGTLLRTFDKLLLPDLTITLKTTPAVFSKQLQKYGNFISGCQILNSTGTQLQCIAQDVTGASDSFTFNMWNTTLNNTNWVKICTGTTTSSSVTFNCDMGNVTDRTFYYSLYVANGLVPIILQADQLNFPSSKVSIYGLFGLFLAVSTILAFAFLGSWNPAIGIVMQMVALLGFVSMGIITISSGAIIFVLIAATIVLYKVKS